MGEERIWKYHVLLKPETIIKAVSKDDYAIYEMIEAYEDYVKAVIIVTAARFNLAKEEISVEDIAQEVWPSFVTKVLPKFRIEG